MISKPLSHPNYCGASVEAPAPYADTRRAIACQGPTVHAADAAVKLGGKFCFGQIFAENAIFRFGFHLLAPIKKAAVGGLVGLGGSS